MEKTGGKSISFFGLVAMGIGCMLGTSWLLLTGTWLETAGGPLNLAVAFALCIVIELPFAFAYMEAIPLLPLPGGEVVYSSWRWPGRSCISSSGAPMYALRWPRSPQWCC